MTPNIFLCGYAICIFSSVYLHNNELGLSALGLFLVFDSITGAMVARKDKKYSSHNLGWGVIAKLLLLFVPFMIAITLQIVGITNNTFLSGSLGLLVMAELSSIINNIHILKTGEAISEQDSISLLLSSINGIVLKKLSGVKKK